jgi:hypothetical protein
MTSRYCHHCHQIIPAPDWAKHLNLESSRRRSRQGTTAQHRAQRQRILQRAHHRCERCGNPGLLELHHVDGDWSNSSDDARVQMLCHDCHQHAHNP